MKVYIPRSGEEFTLQNDWKVKVNWERSNLVWLSVFGWTGKKDRIVHSSEYNSETKQFETYEKVVGKETAFNPLFKNDEGRYQPALCVVPAGTILKVSKYECIYGDIREVRIKCVSCPTKKKLKNRQLVVSLSQFNEIEVEQADAPSNE